MKRREVSGEPARMDRNYPSPMPSPPSILMKNPTRGALSFAADATPRGNELRFGTSRGVLEPLAERIWPDCLP